MSKIALTVKVNQAKPGGDYSLAPGSAADPTATISSLSTAIAAAVTATPDYTAVAADIATLVADGASPTQAHVTALNTAWGTYKTAADAYNADVAALSTTASAATVAADVTLVINLATVTNMNQVRAALRRLEELCASRSDFTA